jgi:hypothetical protein
VALWALGFVRASVRARTGGGAGVGVSYQSHEPAFDFWPHYVIHCKKSLIRVSTPHYPQPQYKYGTCVPLNVEEVIKFDLENGNKFWEMAIAKEMKNITISREQDYTFAHDRPGCHTSQLYQEKALESSFSLLLPIHMMSWQQMFKMIMYKVPHLKKYYAITDDEFGEDKGKTALVSHSLHGLKSSGARW